MPGVIDVRLVSADRREPRSTDHAKATPYGLLLLGEQGANSRLIPWSQVVELAGPEEALNELMGA
jgi:hypothetical protein